MRNIVPTPDQKRRAKIDAVAASVLGPTSSRHDLAYPVGVKGEYTDSRRDGARIYEYARESQLLIDAVAVWHIPRSEAQSSIRKDAITKRNKARAQLSVTQILIAGVLANTRFPRPWKDLSARTQEKLGEILPAQIDLTRDKWPIVLLTVDPNAKNDSGPDLERLALVRQQVGEGIVCQGYFAANLSCKDSEIREVLQQWLNRQRVAQQATDSSASRCSRSKTYLWRSKRPGAALDCLLELRFRCDAKQRHLTFKQACEEEAARNGEKCLRMYRDQSVSDAACKCAIAEFQRMFRTSELPIHHDWQKKTSKG